MTYRQSEMYNCAKYLKNLPLQSVSSKGNLQVAKVSNNKNNEEKNYIGLTERSFKDRLYKHRNSLCYRTKANATELSKYIWDCSRTRNKKFNVWSLCPWSTKEFVSLVDQTRLHIRVLSTKY